MMVNSSLEAYAPRPSEAPQALQGAATQAPQAPVENSAPVIPTASLFDAVDVVLDLSKEGRALYDAYSSLSQEDRSLFIDIIGTVMGQGVVGHESLEVRGAPQQSYAATRLGSEELRQASPAQSSQMDLRI